MNPRHAKRIAFRFLLCASIGGAIFWIFHFPYRFKRLADAIPAAAEVVSYHADLALRWRDVLRNPVTCAALVAGGQTPETLLARIDEAGVDRLMRMLGRRPVLAAYVPCLGVYDRPAIVVAAWAGGHTQLVRWGFFDNALADFTCEPLWKTHRVWRRPCPELGPAQTLTLACFEGVVVAVLSDDPSAIGQLVSQLDWQSSPSSTLAVELGDAGAARDRVVWRPTGTHARRLDGVVRGAAHELHETTAAGRCTFAVPGLHLVSTPAPAHPASLPALLGAMPAALVVGSLGAVADARRALPELGTVTDYLAPALEALPADTGFFVAVSDGIYSGRIMRMRVPALWCGMRLPDDTDPETIVRPILDILNARRKLGLVAEPAGGADGLHLLTSATSGFYARLPRGERGAYARHAGWLIFCSSSDALQALLGATPAAAQPWAADLTVPAAAHAWVDCEQAGSLVRNALAGYTLYTLYAGFVDGTPARRIDTEQLKHAIDAFQRLGTLQARLAGPNTLQLEIRVTTRPAAPRDLTELPTSPAPHADLPAIISQSPAPRKSRGPTDL